MKVTIFSGEALGSREHQIFDLKHRWTCLFNDVQDDIFDYDYFRKLARDTFAFFFPLREKEEIARDILPLIYAIYSFAPWPIGGISDEFEAGQLVARAFCKQVGPEGWRSIHGEFSDKQFAVDGYTGDFFSSTRKPLICQNLLKMLQVKLSGALGVDKRIPLKRNC